MSSHIEELRELDEFTLEWAEARDRFWREDPEGYRRWLAEEWANDLARQHSERWRRVSNRYPHMVAQAYEGDLATALSHSDEMVAARVALWEQLLGFEPRDWYAIGAAQEREESPAA